MAGLDPAIHVFSDVAKMWMRGSSPRMTTVLVAASVILP
jgi:hypothetical protein